MRLPAIKTRPFRLRSRGSLVAATVCAQALVIAVVSALTIQLAQTKLSSRVRDEVAADNRRALAHFVETLEAEAGGPIARATPAWERAQSLVETTVLHHGAFVCLLDTENRVLCHPALRQNPALAGADFSSQPLTLIPGGERIVVGEVYPRTLIEGHADFAGGPADVAVLYRPDLHAKALVYQPENGITAAGARLTGAMVALLGAASLLLLGLTAGSSYALVRRYDSMLMQINRDLEQEVVRKVKAGLTIRNALIFGLAKLADYRDTDTGRHLERISAYCALLANELRPDFPEITDAWVERLKLASSMHDIGKVGIPDSILLKPGLLTPHERRLMEQHPLIGADTLVAIRNRVGDDDLLNMGIEVALHHHERIDGSGYPFGLTGDDIALSARIVALADIYDALTSKRVYKDAMTHEQARAIILAGRAAHLDARVVDAFDRIHSVFEATRRELQPDGFEAEKPALLAAVEQAVMAAAPVEQRAAA